MTKTYEQATHEFGWANLTDGLEGKYGPKMKDTADVVMRRSKELLADREMFNRALTSGMLSVKPDMSDTVYIEFHYDGVDFKTGEDSATVIDMCEEAYVRFCNVSEVIPELMQIAHDFANGEWMKYAEWRVTTAKKEGVE